MNIKYIAKFLLFATVSLLAISIGFGIAIYIARLICNILYFN